MKTYYLAYGSNLNLEQMLDRCPTAQPVGATALKGYKLVFKGDADDYAYLTLEKDEDSSIPLGVFEISSDEDIQSLDYYEGFPELYSKKYLPIDINNEKKEALIYIMNEGFDYHLPSIDYVRTCVEGYKDFDFDKEIIKQAIEFTRQNVTSKKQNDPEYEL